MQKISFKALAKSADDRLLDLGKGRAKVPRDYGHGNGRGHGGDCFPNDDGDVPLPGF